MDRQQQRYYLVRSAGPDKQFNTADDFYAYLHVETRKVAGPPASAEMSIELAIDHDRGPFNGLAEITGSVKDSTGAAVSGATGAVQSGGGAARAAQRNEAGQIPRAGLGTREYQRY